MQVHNYYVGEWVSACNGGRVFADVGVRVWLCACVCVSVYVLVSALVRVCVRVHLSLS